MWYTLTILMFILSLIVSAIVNGRFKKYSKYKMNNGITGATAAAAILQFNGIYDVEIRQIKGNLTDNYSPVKKTLNLSESVYGRSNISAICVAAHEAGHAIQHAHKSPLLMLRKSICPVVNFCSFGSYIAILLGVFLSKTHFITFGCILFSAIVIFNLITLPVEIDASKKALECIRSLDIMPEDYIRKGRKVLIAAAMTYFMSLLSSIVQLLKLLSIINRR